MVQHRPRRLGAVSLAAVLALVAPAAMAAELDGARLGFAWAIPFIGVLLSIAILPLAAPQLWHHHFGKITAAWSLAFVLPYAAMDGVGATAPRRRGRCWTMTRAPSVETRRGSTPRRHRVKQI